MKPKRLNQFFATALCGNDILSSTLYVSGIAIFFAGIYAPIVLLLIGLLLFFYKAVYTEVVESLPINGGVYNCLLNGSSKIVAAIAGVITFLSYIATAVLSAKIGVVYLHTIWSKIAIIPVTIGLLGVFAVLVLLGVRNSAKIASVFFVFHIITLIALIIAGVLNYMHGHSYFMENWEYTHQLIANHGGLAIGLYLAFSASLLGVSGFESSSNFIEEHEKGVFRKTLRNMLICVLVVNPLMALIALNSMPFEAIAGARDFLLADTAQHIGGTALHYWVAIDAGLVLSGAVLTSYVGVSGLLSRMSYDACLPAFIGKMNSKGAHPRIAFGFFVLCSSILLMTSGDTFSLAGVYTVAFLSVMTLFGVGNLILRQSRSDLKRTYRAPLLFVALASVGTFSGIIGNIRINPQNVQFFEIYFVPAVIIVLGVVYQDQIIRALVNFTKKYASLEKISRYLDRKFPDLVQGKFIAFIHHANRLHKILEYISRNETGRDIILVHCKNPKDVQNLEFERIKNILPILQEVGVFPHLKFTLEHIEQKFGPKLIEYVSEKYNVRKNRIMVGLIEDFDDFNYQDVEGVRIIL